MGLVNYAFAITISEQLLLNFFTYLLWVQFR